MRSLEWIQTPHGREASFDKTEIPEGMWDVTDFQGRTVDIDGQPYRVIGVNRFLLNVSPDFPYRLPFGLLVEPEEM